MIDFYADVMNTAVVRNPDILEILNKQVDLVRKVDLDLVHRVGEEADRDYYVSREYCDKIRYMGAGHLGFPEQSYGFELAEGKINYRDEKRKFELEQEANEIGHELQAYLGAHNKALHMIYPPGGFIGWHNNANAPGYNILFTWSEKGDGYWEHIDPKTGEVVHIPDVEGWQCKYGYYGTYAEPERICYHAASTNCLRSTVAFVFNADETGKMMAEMVVEEIETA